MSLTMVDYICEYCKEPFRRRSGRRHRFCSSACANAGARKITAEMLAPHAERGTPRFKVAAELKINLSAFAVAMRRYGLYRLWCERRYTKCASPTVGCVSVSTVFDAAITPSAKSAA
jgi:hypothetical protein